MWKEWILDLSRNIHIVYGLIMPTFICREINKSQRKLFYAYNSGLKIN
jgi:hypothetical protein